MKTPVLEIQNDAEQFGTYVPNGQIVYCKDDLNFYQLTQAATPTMTLATTTHIIISDNNVGIINGIISGGERTWLYDYTFGINPTSYVIGGASYNSPADILTLSAPDGTFDRIDLFVVNTSSVVEVIEGVPAATPLEPDYDPATQLYLGFVLVSTGTTQPVDIVNDWMYMENVGAPVEWNAVSSHAQIDLNSINTPFVGIKCIEATAAINGRYVTFTGVPNLGTYNAINFMIKSKAAWGTKTLTLRWLNAAGNGIGNPVIVADGSFGFDSTDTTNYQSVTVPLWLFGNISIAQGFKIINTCPASTNGWFIDNVQLQNTSTIVYQGSQGEAGEDGVLLWDMDLVPNFSTFEIVHSLATNTTRKTIYCTGAGNGHIDNKGSMYTCFGYLSFASNDYFIKSIVIDDGATSDDFPNLLKLVQLNFNTTSAFCVVTAIGLNITNGPECIITDSGIKALELAANGHIVLNNYGSIPVTWNIFELTDATATLTIYSYDHSSINLDLIQGAVGTFTNVYTDGVNFTAGDPSVLANFSGTYVETKVSKLDLSYKTGTASYTGTGTAGINTVETEIVISEIVIPKNRLRVGTTMRCTWIGTCNSSAANTSTFTVHFGTNGTVADGLLASATTGNAGTGAGNVPFKAVMEITLRTVGATTTAYGMLTVQSQGNGGIVGAGGQNTAVATMTSINTKTDLAYLTLAYYSAAITTTSTFQSALIEIIHK